MSRSLNDRLVELRKTRLPVDLIGGPRLGRQIGVFGLFRDLISHRAAGPRLLTIAKHVIDFGDPRGHEMATGRIDDQMMIALKPAEFPIGDLRDGKTKKRKGRRFYRHPEYL